MDPRVSSHAVFSADPTSRPVSWLDRLILKAGDVEQNPGPPLTRSKAKKQTKEKANNNSLIRNDNNNLALLPSQEGDYIVEENFDFEGFTSED